MRFAEYLSVPGCCCSPPRLLLLPGQLEGKVRQTPPTDWAPADRLIMPITEPAPVFPGTCTLITWDPEAAHRGREREREREKERERETGDMFPIYTKHSLIRCSVWSVYERQLMDNEPNESNFWEHIRGGWARFVVADTGSDVREQSRWAREGEEQAGGVCRSWLKSS